MTKVCTLYCLHTLLPPIHWQARATARDLKWYDVIAMLELCLVPILHMDSSCNMGV